MSNQNNTAIKNKLEIISLLRRIHKSKQMISLSFASLPQHSLTSLLEVHHDARVLVFDEPNPEVSDKLIENKKEAEFSMKLEQLPLSFKTEIISIQQHDNNNRLYTHFPKEMFYTQKRFYYRCRTEFIEDITTTVFLSSQHRLQCELVNISLTGLCLRLPYSFASMFRENQVIGDINIQLPGEQSFSVAAKIQNTRVEKNYSNIALGLMIQNQEHRIEKTIQRFIYRAERQHHTSTI